MSAFFEIIIISFPASLSSLQILTLREYCRRESWKILGAREQGVCCEILSSRNIWYHTHKVSSTWLPTQELNKARNNRDTKLDKQKSTEPQPYTRGYKQLRNTENGRNTFTTEEHTNWLPHMKMEKKIFDGRSHWGIWYHHVPWLKKVWDGEIIWEEKKSANSS